jgi:hypothetical protein
MTRENMPNFFSVVDEMAKRFIELMQSDYRLKRKTTTGAGRSLTTNRVNTGTLNKSLAYRLKIKKSNIGVSVFAKGKASKYFGSMEDGRGANKKSPPSSVIYDWINQRGIKLRDKDGRIQKQTESLKRSVAFLIARSIGKKGIKGWNAFEYALENTWEEYEEKLFVAYGKDFEATLNTQFQ